MSSTVAVSGATGRLGRLITRIVETSDGLDLVASLDSSCAHEELLAAELLVDATPPAASHRIVPFAIEHGRKVLVASSGWSADRIASLRSLVAAHPGSAALVVPNFSLGSVLGTALAAVAGRFFDSIEIIEAHRAAKVDSPSGTSVRTAELIGAARAERGPVRAPHADQLARGQQVASIPIHSLRMDGVVAAQRVLMGAPGELLTISHELHSDTAYEQGISLALAALPEAEGVSVGLDALLDLGLPPLSEPATSSPGLPEAGSPTVSGQAARATAT